MRSKMLRFLNAGTISGWLHQIVGAVGALILVPYLIEQIGMAKAGIWLSAQAVIGLAGLADFGISIVSARQIAFISGRSNGSSVARGDIGELLPYAGTLLSVMSLARLANQIACGISIILVSVFVLQFASMGNSHAVCILGVSAIVRLSSRPNAALLDGLGMVATTRLINSAQQILSIIGVFLVIAAGYELVAMAIWVLMTCSAEKLALALFAKRVISVKAPQREVAPVRRKSILLLYKIAIPLGLVSVGGYFISSFQAPMVGLRIGTEAVAPFFVSYKICAFANLAALQLLIPSVPKYTALLGQGKFRDSYCLSRKCIGSAITVQALLLVGFVGLAPIFFEALFKIAPLGIVTRTVMAIDLLLLGASVAVGNFILASGSNPLWPFTIACGCLNIFFLYLLLPQFGVLGAPLSGLLSGLFTIYPWTAYKGLKFFEYSRFLRALALKT